MVERPWTLRRRPWVVAVLLALLVVVAVAPAPPAAASPAAESAFVGRINGVRQSRGLNSLIVDGDLVGVARAWAAHMADAGGISHNPNLGGGVSSNWTKLGENVGVGSTVDELHGAFMASSGHAANIVDPDWTHVGVGVVERNGLIYTSHMFMAVAGAPAPPPPAPAPASGPAPGGSSSSGGGGGGGGGTSGGSSSSDLSSGGGSGGGGGGGAPAPPGGPALPPAPPAPDPMATLPAVLRELRLLDAQS